VWGLRKTAMTIAIKNKITFFSTEKQLCELTVTKQGHKHQGKQLHLA